MLRLTLDTSVITSAARSRSGPSFALVEAFYQRRFVMPTSFALFLEYESVLKRPEQQAIDGASIAVIDRFLDDLADRILEVRVSWRYRPLLPDPNDELVAEAALNGGADALITYNVRDFAPLTQRFGLRITTPAMILKEGKLHL